jgi:hypothetical protein
MGKLAARKNRVKQMVSLGAVNPAAEELLADLDARVEAIQLLIPLGLQAVAEELYRAVVELAGARYQRKDSEQPHRRWGSQPGSVFLGDQKLPVTVPRVRKVENRKTYRVFKGPILTHARKQFSAVAVKVLRCFLSFFRMPLVFDGGVGGRLGSWSCRGSCRVCGLAF